MSDEMASDDTKDDDKGQGNKMKWSPCSFRVFTIDYERLVEWPLDIHPHSLYDW